MCLPTIWVSSLQSVVKSLTYFTIKVSLFNDLLETFFVSGFLKYSVPSAWILTI